MKVEPSISLSDTFNDWPNGGFNFENQKTARTMCDFVEASSLCPLSRCRTFEGRCSL